MTNNTKNEQVFISKNTPLKEVIKVRQLKPDEILQEGDYIKDLELVNFQQISCLIVGMKVSAISSHFGETFRGFFRKVTP